MPLKLLDYGETNPFGATIGKTKSLAWPVNVYRVTLPRVSEHGDGLNPFECVILKIIDAGGAPEAEELARDTCIPLDLVQCVVLRLRDQAFIDEHNEIVERKRYDWDKEEGDPTDFVTALVFRELATRQFLPFVHQADDNNPIKKKEREEKFFKRVYYEKWQKNSPPTPRNVISALRAMDKRSFSFGQAMRLPAVRQITIADDPEQYHLDCRIAIQKIDGEFRIADPFGNGFSLVLERAFSSLLGQDNGLSDWLMNWKAMLSNPRQKEQTAIHKELYDNDANQVRYPNLISNLRLRRHSQHRSILQIYAALEWALFYVCAQRPYDTAVNQLRFADQLKHPDILKEAAEKVGLNLPQYGLRAVFSGKLDAFLAGKAEMGTVLSIAIVMAEHDVSHPLRRIAAQQQDFIIRIFDIKKKRDSQGHGQGKVQKNEIELPEEAFMREVVTVLLPAMRFSETSVAKADKDVVADSLFDARTSIQNDFGFGLFNRLGTVLQDRLIHAECFWLSCKDGDDAIAFACDIYAALQRAFHQKLSGVLPPDTRDSEFSETAQKNANQSGLGHLPESLRTVAPIAIRNTLQGDNQTLGACVVAFLLVSDAETLRSVADIQPSFLSDVETIVIRRGHGNQPLPLPKGDIGELRETYLSTIKTLLEV